MEPKMKVPLKQQMEDALLKATGPELNQVLEKRLKEDSKKQTLEAIDLAIAANGGETHRQEWCNCEPEVGFVPCEYCAIFNGLRLAKQFFESL